MLFIWPGPDVKLQNYQFWFFSTQYFIVDFNLERTIILGETNLLLQMICKCYNSGLIFDVKSNIPFCSYHSISF